MNDEVGTVNMESRPSQEVRQLKPENAFVEYMLVQVQTTQESFNLLTRRSDGLVTTYLTTATGTLAAVVLLLAAMQQTPYVVFAGLGTAGVILGMMGVVTSLSYVSTRRRRVALGSSLQKSHLFFAEIDPVAFSKFGGGFQAYQALAWWPSTVALGVCLFHCVLFALGVGLLACALVVANPGMPLSLNLWWIALATIVLSGVLCAIAARMYRHIMSESAKPAMDLTADSFGPTSKDTSNDSA